MADYYVQTVGNGGLDTNDGSQPTQGAVGVGPKLTIQAAYGLVSANSTIWIGEGTYDFDDEPNGQVAVTANFDVTFAGWSAGTVDRNAVICQDAVTSSLAAIFYVKNQNVTTFKDMYLKIDNNLRGLRWDGATTDLGSLVIDNTKVISTAGTNSYAIRAETTDINNNRKITIKNNSIVENQSTESSNAFRCYNTTNNVSGQGLSELVVQNSTLRSATTESARILLAVTETAKVSIYKSTFEAAACNPIVIVGKDEATNAVPLGDVYINQCSIKYTGLVGGHALILGAGVNAGFCTYNDIYAPPEDSSLNFGIVIKGFSTVGFNLVQAERGILLKGALEDANQGFDKIFNNTVIAHGTYADSACFQWGNINDGAKDYIPLNCRIENNIFQAENSSYCLLLKDSGGTLIIPTSNNGYYFNNNCYFGDVLLRDAVNSINYTTFDTEATGIFTYWQAQTDLIWADINDQDSLNEDPRLDSDNKPHNPAVTKGGVPDVSGGNTSIGAIGATAGGKGRYSGGGRYS